MASQGDKLGIRRVGGGPRRSLLPDHIQREFDALHAKVQRESEDRAERRERDIGKGLPTEEERQVSAELNRRCDWCLGSILALVIYSDPCQFYKIAIDGDSGFSAWASIARKHTFYGLGPNEMDAGNAFAVVLDALKRGDLEAIVGGNIACRESWFGLSRYRDGVVTAFARRPYFDRYKVIQWWWSLPTSDWSGPQRSHGHSKSIAKVEIANAPIPMAPMRRRGAPDDVQDRVVQKMKEMLVQSENPLESLAQLRACKQEQLSGLFGIGLGKKAGTDARRNACHKARARVLGDIDFINGFERR